MKERIKVLQDKIKEIGKNELSRIKNYKNKEKKWTNAVWGDIVSEVMEEKVRNTLTIKGEREKNVISAFKKKYRTENSHQIRLL